MMDKRSEMDSLHAETLRLCEQWAQVRKIPMPNCMYECEKELTGEGEAYVNCCAIQLCQMMEFYGFITITAESYFNCSKNQGGRKKLAGKGCGSFMYFWKSIPICLRRSTAGIDSTDIPLECPAGFFFSLDRFHQKADKPGGILGINWALGVMVWGIGTARGWTR